MHFYNKYNTSYSAAHLNLKFIKGMDFLFIREFIFIKFKVMFMLSKDIFHFFFHENKVLLISYFSLNK